MKESNSKNIKVLDLLFSDQLMDEEITIENYQAFKEIIKLTKNKEKKIIIPNEAIKIITIEEAPDELVRLTDYFPNVKKLIINSIYKEQLYILGKPFGELIFDELIINIVIPKRKKIKPIHLIKIANVTIKEKLSIISVNAPFKKIDAFHLQNIKFEKGSTCELTNIKADKIIFDDIDFSPLKEFIFEKSNINNLETTSVIWKHNLSADVSKKDVDKKEYKKSLLRLRDTYRQLKYAMEKQNDRIEALKFQAKEMDTHRKTLSPVKNFGEWFILWLGKISNDHGQNWWLPLLIWFPLFSFFFFSKYINSSNSIYSESELLKGFALFLNPIKSTIFEKFEATPLSEFIFLSWHIVFAYLLYQTLIAFRKYTRKI